MTGSLFELPAVCSASAILWVKRCSALSGAVVIDCDQFDLKQWCRCVNTRADVAAASCVCASSFSGQCFEGSSQG